MELIRGRVMVELEDIGEGYSGDYNEDDPDDAPLLRFTVFESDDEILWKPVDKASYCTNIRADTPEARQREILELIMDEVADAVESGDSIKTTCERLSWLEA